MNLLQRDLTHGTLTPDCPNPILIIANRLRKIRSQLLSNAVAYGNHAIVLLRPDIPPKSTAAKNVGALPPSSSESGNAVKLRGGLTKNTVEQITAVKNVPINNADEGAESMKNNFYLPSHNSNQPKAHPICPYLPRAIQIRQNRDAEKNPAANVRVVSSLGIATQGHLTKSSVVRCVTTLYALPVSELNATTRLVARSEESPPPTA